MNERTFRALEFDSVKNLISELAFSDAAKESIRKAVPTANRYLIANMISELDEMVRFTLKYSSIPIGAYYVNSAAVGRAVKGGVLSNREFIRISRSIKCASDVRNHVLSSIEKDDFEFLRDYSENIAVLKNLRRMIDDVVLDDENISDRASSELYAIRRQKRNINSRIREKLNQVVRSKTQQKYLSENIVTIRYSRFVIPVKSEYRSKIPGIVHDTSQSGATVYIEPESVVNMNNELKELEVRENREIERIMRNLSSAVADSSNDLEANERILLYLDELNAKCQFAVERGYSKPEFSRGSEMVLKSARHPLIDSDRVVASDIVMDSGYGAFIITGPNTGGKTVSLKTVGLCQLMFQAGMFIPAADGSTLPVYERIFADIGDEQSIEQSLSTFSAHMTSIIDIVRMADSSTLVLLDEICAGTDPVEGAAIATALIDTLKKRGAKTFCTTHYSELKEYALMNDDVLNASVEFDVRTLSPTFRLIVGIPGKSNAFEISEKLGLDRQVLDKARLYLSDDDNRFEDVIRELNEKTAAAEKSRRKAESLLEENERLNEELQAEKKSLEDAKSKMMLDASLEAKKLIVDAKEESRKIIQRLSKLERKGGGSDMRSAVDSERKRMKKLEEGVNAHIPEHELRNQGKKSKNTFKKGDEVFIPSLNRTAVILSLQGTDSAYVQAGIVKTKLPLSSLEPARAAKSHAKKVAYSYKNQKAKTVKPTLDIRGMYSDDAELAVEKYLDDAYLAGLSRVIIIHGRGTGVLRNTVWDMLRTNRNVKRYAHAGMNEGGDGATVVNFR